MKKFIATIVCFILVFTFVMFAYADGSFPDTPGSLPYTSDWGTIYVGTYTNVKFYPTSTKKIKVKFYGNCSKVVVYNLALATGDEAFFSPVVAYFPNVSGSVSTTTSWSGLNQNTQYAGYMGLNSPPSSTSAKVKGAYSAG